MVVIGRWSKDNVTLIEEVYNHYLTLWQIVRSSPTREGNVEGITVSKCKCRTLKYK